MANSAQSRKRARQAISRRTRNMASRSTVRTSIKKIRAAISLGDKDAAQSAFKAATPVIDRMSRKGILDKNAASRYKSRLSKAIKLIGA